VYACACVDRWFVGVMCTEILYKNVKHAVFHATVKEIFVLVHFHLHDPIMVGKKKATDVQFCAEAIEASQRLDNAKRRMTDQDEIQEEQEERARVNRLNKLFDRFVVAVEQAVCSTC
jgi:nucleosome binding factor SPN SPT16 subunit